MGKRIFLFIATNLAIVLTISLITNLLGLNYYLSQNGIDYKALAGFALVYGFTGAFISLLLSKTMAKFSMGIKVIEKGDPMYGNLYRMVEQLALKAGLPKTPEVGIYESPEVNAFATGPTKRNSIVAFSTGLLNNMQPNEIEGVAGHEIAHIKNGDMVTMTLLQGVMNAFVIFFARALAFAIGQAMSKNSDREEGEAGGVSYLTYTLVSFVLELVLGILASLIVSGFSRWREFHADKGGAQYAGKHDMIAALQRLMQNSERVDHSSKALAAMKISSGKGGWLRLFATHPPLEERIAALKSAA